MMTMPVDQSWSVNLSVRNDRRWFGFNSVAITYIAAILDFLVMLLASAGGYTLYQLISSGHRGRYLSLCRDGLLVATIFVLAMGVAHAYRAAEMLSFRRQIATICSILPAVLVFLLAIIFFLKIGTAVSRGAILSAAFLSFGALAALRMMWRAYLSKAVSNAAFPTRRVLLMCPDAAPVEPIIRRQRPTGFPSSIRCTSFKMANSKPGEAGETWYRRYR
jgi:putative colanic acid biosynthesis UDP-glucose lipid carrier transferase